MKKINYIIVNLIILLFLEKAKAEIINEENTLKNEDKTFFNKVSNIFSDVWNSNIYDLYIPVNTWHNRALYDKEKTDKYTENPWGIGFGKTKVDSKGNFHQLYAMEFQDSHNKVELMFGYNYQKNWYFWKDFRVGVGITAGITIRDDFYYIPVPLALPIASISYKMFSIETTYIPGTYNSGNVLFTWLRFSFKM